MLKQLLIMCGYIKECTLGNLVDSRGLASYSCGQLQLLLDNEIKAIDQGAFSKSFNYYSLVVKFHRHLN